MLQTNASSFLDYFLDASRCLFEDNTCIPSHEDLSSLPLLNGRNNMDFCVDETVVASGALFLWRCDDRVIVVDIDGTITKAISDDMMPLL